MRSLLFVALLGLLGTGSTSRAQSSFEVPVKEGPRPWIIPADAAGENDLHFAVIGNIPTERTARRLGDALKQIATLHPAFAISTGTLLGFPGSSETAGSRWDQILFAVRAFSIPFFICPGATELAKGEAETEWGKRFGPAYYHFSKNGVLFCVLNSEENPSHRISPEQIIYFQKAIGKPGDYRFVCLFMNHPLWQRASDTGWAAIEQMLGEREYAAFSGASGRYSLAYRKARRHVSVPPLAAAGDLRGPEFGEFEGFTWVTISGSQIAISAIDTDGIHGPPTVDDTTLALIKALDSNPVSISPLRTRDRNFTSQKFVVRAENTTEVPMQVNVKIDNNRIIRFVPQQLNKVIGPKTTDTLEFDCRTMRPIPAGNPDAVVVRGSVAYLPPGGQPISSEFIRKVSVEAPAAVPLRKTTYAVDGRMLEWGIFPYVCNDPVQVIGGSWTGPEDCSFKFNVARDDEMLYLAMEVVDDSVVVNRGRQPGEQDSVQILLNPNAPGSAPVSQEKLLTFSMAPGDVAKETTFKKGENWPTGARGACIRTIHGINAELAIPLEALKQAQGGDWSGFQLNVVVNDFDAAKQPKQVWWRPGWTESQIDPQSAVFTKE